MQRWYKKILFLSEPSPIHFYKSCLMRCNFWARTFLLRLDYFSCCHQVHSALLHTICPSWSDSNAAPKNYVQPEQRQPWQVLCLHLSREEESTCVQLIHRKSTSRILGARQNRLPGVFTHCMPCLGPGQPWLGRNPTVEVFRSWNAEGFSPLRGEVHWDGRHKDEGL